MLRDVTPQSERGGDRIGLSDVRVVESDSVLVSRVDLDMTK